MTKAKNVFVEPSASGPSQKLENHKDGTVHVTPGSLGQAREGKVTNPGVRSLSGALSAPRCPSCGEATLKMHMNKPSGQRIYCSRALCGYDQAKLKGDTSPSDTKVKVVNNQGLSGGGVKILRQTGAR